MIIFIVLLFELQKDLKFSKVVSVYTEMTAVKFAEEIVVLGDDFMDKYEDPLLHRFDEQIENSR